MREGGQIHVVNAQEIDYVEAQPRPGARDRMQGGGAPLRVLYLPSDAGRRVAERLGAGRVLEEGTIVRDADGIATITATMRDLIS